MNSSAATGLPTRLVMWRLIRYAWREFTIHTLLVISSFSLQIVPGLVAKAVFDGLETAQKAALGGGAGRAVDTGYLILLVGLYILAELLGLGLRLGLEWYGWTFRCLVAALFRRNILASLLRRNLAWGLPVSPGEAVNRFRHDVEEVSDFPTWLPDQLGKWVAAIIALVIMARIDLLITLVIFIPLVFILLITRWAWNKILNYSRAVGQATDQVTGFLGEIFNAVQAIQLADAVDDVSRRLSGLNNLRQAAMVGENVFRRLLDSINNSAVTFGIGMMLLLAGAAIRQGTFSVGDFALFASYLWFTTAVPSEIGTFMGDFKTQGVSIERMLELVRPEAEECLVENHPGYLTSDLQPRITPALTDSQQELARLRVTGLSYHYPSNGRGVQNISFTLDRGSLTIITGRVGAGKTTLLRALLGLLPLEQGTIEWNGQPVTDAATFFQPPLAAYTPQAPRLFSASLKENILCGLPEELYDLDAALRLGVFEQDVAELTQGLDTLVGPRGVRLSGGQVQRAAAVRMFIRKPELVILDDISSALDVETEQKLWERLAEQPGLTVLAVSHRKPALKRADQVIVLKDGAVTGQGSLDALLQTCQEMQEIWQGEVS